MRQCGSVLKSLREDLTPEVRARIGRRITHRPIRISISVRTVGEGSWLARAIRSQAGLALVGRAVGTLAAIVRRVGDTAADADRLDLGRQRRSFVIRGSNPLQQGGVFCAPFSRSQQ